MTQLSLENGKPSGRSSMAMRTIGQRVVTTRYDGQTLNWCMRARRKSPASAAAFYRFKSRSAFNTTRVEQSWHWPLKDGIKVQPRRRMHPSKQSSEAQRFRTIYHNRRDCENLGPSVTFVPL